MASRSFIRRAARLASILLSFGLAAGSQAEPRTIGEVERTQSTVTGEVAGQRRELRKAAPIFANEAVTTGLNARAGLLFKDGSRLTIGAEAKVVLDQFVFNDTGGGAISLLKGALRFTSGKMARKNLRVVTPVATIGIRGTDFWFGQIDGAYGVLLLQGEVEVSNDGGSVILDEPLQGTVIYSPSAAPGSPGIWPGDRRARALASVTFN